MNTPRLALASIALVSSLILPSLSHARLDSCGGIFLSGEASCEFVRAQACENKCEVTSVETACVASLQTQCETECTQTAEVACTETCTPVCTEECTTVETPPTSKGMCRSSCAHDCNTSCETSENMTLPLILLPELQRELREQLPR